MGLFDFVKSELIDVIEWVDASSDAIVWKYPRKNGDHEIKNGAKLTVRESQQAVFLNEGTLADVFKPGMYELKTQNMPLLSTLKGWKYGFDSPFKADVFFVNTKQFPNQKWGTKNPAMYRCPEFGPIRIRAFGSFAFKVSDAGLFLKEISGTNPDFSVDEINEQLRNLVVTRGMDAIAESKVPVIDMTSNMDEFSKLVADKVRADFNEIGLDITKFLIENISLPEEVEKKLDARSSMGILGNLGAYSQMQAADAMQAAANNPNGGGMMGAGMGMGMGMGMGNQMAGMFQQNQFNPNQQQQQMQQPGMQNTPPPPPQMSAYFVAVNGQQTGPFTVQQLQGMIAGGQFTAASQVWKQGMPAWGPASGVPELQALFGAMPPPPPPIA